MDDQNSSTSDATEATAPSADADNDYVGARPQRWRRRGRGRWHQRFSAKRKLAAVQRLMRGESPDAVSREENDPVHRLTAWRDRVLLGAESALKERERDARDDEIARRAGPGWARSPCSSRVRKSVRGTDFSKNELLYARIDNLEGSRPLARRRSKT